MTSSRGNKKMGSNLTLAYQVGYEDCRNCDKEKLDKAIQKIEAMQAIHYKIFLKYENSDKSQAMKAKGAYWFAEEVLKTLREIM